MNKTIVVCGHGPGISDAVARKFGQSGFQVAIVARSKDKLEAAAGRLRDEGIVAKAFPCDLGDATRIKALFADIESALGPATALHWNVYTGGAGDLLTAPDGELSTVLSVAVNGLVAATQCVVPKMQAGEGAILVTGGGFAFYDETVEKMAIDFHSMGLAIGKAAQHKATRLLHKKLAGQGIFVGEVTVLGMVKGTAFDSGHANLDPADIANAFFKLYEDRQPMQVLFK